MRRKHCLIGLNLPRLPRWWGWDMAANVQFLRISKLKGVGIIKRAALHNLREFDVERSRHSIDGRRTR